MTQPSEQATKQDVTKKTPQFLTVSDIEAAQKTITGQVVRPSFRRAPRLSNKIGSDIFIKFENEHVSGSFKERGALNKILSLTENEKKAGVIAASAGNHAQGVAYHAGRLGIPSVIVMPRATPMAKVEATRAYGANVILVGNTFDECYDAMCKIQVERGLTLIHPFNDLKIMAGQGTIGLEVHEEADDDMEAFIVPIGGGGMISGIATALKAKRPNIKIYGVQASLYPHFYNRRHNIEDTDNAQPQATLAEGIAVKKPGDICYLTANPLIEDVILVDEKLIEQAISMLATENKNYC